MKELLKDKKFKYLLAALFFVVIFEIMSLMNIHFNDIAGSYIIRINLYSNRIRYDLERHQEFS